LAYAIITTPQTGSVVDKLYESPEFARFQFVAPVSELLSLDGASDTLLLGKLFSSRFSLY
jgi:hypothetical protein